MDRRSFQNLNAEDQATLHFSPACAPEEIICSGSDTEESDESIRQKRVRYEEQARGFIRGRLPVLQSASLRGPLDSESGWINPWRYRKPENPSWWQPGSEEMLFTRPNVMKRAADHGLGYLTPAEALAWCKRTAMFEAESAERSPLQTNMVESNNKRLVDEDNEEDEEEVLAVFSNAAQTDTTLVRREGQRGEHSTSDFGEQPQESARGVKRPIEWLKGSYVSKRARWNGPSIATPTPIHNNGRDGQRRRNMVPNGSAISSRGQHNLGTFPPAAPQTPRAVSLEYSLQQELILDDGNVPQHSPHYEQSLVQQELAQVSRHQRFYLGDSSTLKHEDSNMQRLREDWNGNKVQHHRRDSLDLSQISPFVVNFGSSEVDLNLQISIRHYDPRHSIEMPNLENSSPECEAVGSTNHSLPKLPRPTAKASRFAQVTPAIFDEDSFVTEVAPSSRNVEEFQFKKKRSKKPHLKTSPSGPINFQPNSEPELGTLYTKENQRSSNDPESAPHSQSGIVGPFVLDNLIINKHSNDELQESKSPLVAIHADINDTSSQSSHEDTPGSDDRRQEISLHSPAAHILTNPSLTKVPTPSPKEKSILAPVVLSSVASPSPQLPAPTQQSALSQTGNTPEPTSLLIPGDSGTQSFNTTPSGPARFERTTMTADVLSTFLNQPDEPQDNDIRQLKLQEDMGYKDERLPGTADYAYLVSNSQLGSPHAPQDLEEALVDVVANPVPETSSEGQAAGDDLIEEKEAREVPYSSNGISQVVDISTCQSPPGDITRTPVPHSQVVEPSAQTPWAKTNTQTFSIVPAMRPEPEVEINLDSEDVGNPLEEPEESLQEQPQEYNQTDSIGWYPVERSMTPDSNHIMLLKDLMTPPSPAKRSQTMNSLPSTQLIFDAALENPWTNNKGKQARSSNRKTGKRVSFGNLPSGESDDSQDSNPVPTSTMHSPPPPRELEDDEDILEDVVKGFGNHFRAARRATRSIATSTSDLLSRRPFTRLIPEQDNNNNNSSPSVGAMAEAFIAADREASLRLQQNPPTPMSRHLKPRSESMDNAGRRGNSDGEKISGNSLLAGFEMDDILGEVDGYLELWSVDAELEKARQQQSEAESNGTKRRRLFGIV